MNNIFHTIQHTARAATVLLLALLTAQTAGANDAVTYIGMDGKTKTVTEYTYVTTDMNLYWSSGTYVVKSSVTLNGCIRFDYPAVIDLIVCDGATLTVNGNSIGAFDGNTLNIYAQSNGTGMGVVNVKKKTKCIQLNIAGGKVTLDDDGAGYGLYVYSGDACGLTVNGGDVTIQNSDDYFYGAITFYGNGFVTLNGGKLTVTNSKGNDYKAIDGYGDSNNINFNGGTVVINGKIIDFNNINLNGGNVTVNGEIDNSYGYTVTYDFTHATDSYYIKAFSNNLYSSATRTVQVKDGAAFRCDGNKYIGPLTLTDNQISAISAQTMTPDISNHFSVNDAGTEYTIHTAKGWDLFCELLEAGESFSGKTVELANDITVTRCAGSGAGSDLTASDRPFCGTFDGQGNTLTFNYGSSYTPADENNIAPFRYVNNATIQHLHVVGDIYTQHVHAGGIVGMAYGTTNITDCRSSVNIISSITGDGTHGGIMSCSWTGSTTSITGCLFDGSIQSASGYTTNQCGGFVGWRNATINVSNSLLTADLSTIDTPDGLTYPSATFVRNGHNNTITNCYYTEPFGTAQGKARHTVTAGTDVTVAHAGVATHYATSGITAYKATGASTDSDPFIAGLLYNNNVVDVLYAGSGDVVSLTLSNTATGAPAGYQYAGYTANAGTLDDNNILTMPDEDVTVSLALAVLPWTGDGSKGNPYIIYNKDQLDLLAHRVNGTHGETCQTNGYKDTYFKLNNDISYPHTTDWDDAECEQESNFEAIGGYYDDFRSFCGHFDGNNKTISGIRIYRGGYNDADRFQGIFGYTGQDADIHDLTLADTRITGYDFTGGIVGDNNDGTVSGCHVAGDVAVCAVQSDAYYHGGIVGYNDGTIQQCTSAATLTTADDSDSKYYGGIVGENFRGTLRDNLAIGATVPAAKDNTYGAITGKNDGGSLLRNYYAACKVADTENATGVGCGYISDGNDGYTTADVTANNGAVSIHTLTLADGITTATAATVTIGTTGYYAQGTAIALSYSGDVPLGYQYEDGDGFTASAGTLNGNTLTMPAADVTVSLALRSTGELVEVSYVDADGTTRTAQAIALDGHEADLGIDGTETWYFVGLPTVAIDHTLDLYGDVHLILADGCTMNVTSSNDIVIDVDGSLTIYGQTDGTGALNATGFFVGIFTDSGTITISGGRVTATSGTGYGIHSDHGNLTISGGRVTATGGTGISTNSGTITISGGRVTATGSYGIYINSGTITLGCTTASDFIYASSYFVGPEGSLNIADGQTLYDEDGNYYSGNGVTIPNGKTLRPGLTARQAPDGNYWTTYYNGTQGFTIDENENACAYTATYGGSQLTLHNLGKEIPAGTAVIIVADNSVVSMTATDLPAYSGGANALRGVDDDTPTSALGTGTFYVLGMTTVGNEKHFGFHRYTGLMMAAHKAFVLVDNSQARSLTMVFDEASGIESLTPDAAPKAQAADLWFTLDGRRLQAKPTAPGIYVNNGRKVVIK